MVLKLILASKLSELEQFEFFWDPGFFLLTLYMPFEKIMERSGGLKEATDVWVFTKKITYNSGLQQHNVQLCLYHVMYVCILAFTGSLLGPVQTCTERRIDPLWLLIFCKILLPPLINVACGILGASSLGNTQFCVRWRWMEKYKNVVLYVNLCHSVKEGEKGKISDGHREKWEYCVPALTARWSAWPAPCSCTCRQRPGW